MTYKVRQAGSLDTQLHSLPSVAGAGGMLCCTQARMMLFGASLWPHVTAEEASAAREVLMNRSLHNSVVAFGARSSAP